MKEYIKAYIENIKIESMDVVTGSNDTEEIPACLSNNG